MLGNEITRTTDDAIDGEVMDAPDPTVVSGELIMGFCRAIGFDPHRVARIEMDVRTVIVERHRLRNGKPYVDTDGDIAKEHVRLAIDWSGIRP